MGGALLCAPSSIPPASSEKVDLAKKNSPFEKLGVLKKKTL